MNETIESNSSEQASLQNTSSDTSAGAMLREARELEGLDIAALAVSLKVPVKKLEALEADRFDLLPDTVFARALAASVFHFGTFTIPAVKDYMAAAGVPVRHV